MPTPADVRKIAMALDGVSEVDHWGRPAYRTTKRIFAVMRPDGLNLMVSEERKEFLFEADPETFVKHYWGKRPYMVVQIERISKKELEALIREAWELNRPPPAKAKPPASKKPPAKRKAPMRARI